MKILVAVDGSEFSKNAVRFASCLAMKIKAEVIALRINDVPRYSHWMGISDRVKEEMFETSEKIIQEAGEIARDEFDMGVTGVIREGSPVEEIVKLVNEDQEISMVVLGASGKGNAARRLVGSTTESLIHEVSRSLHCAVIVVPGSDEIYSRRCTMVHS
ncbi:MAG TPA: universal stress protein [Thermodesulfovibrionales bacterium]|nr:universal stress protein [Thermodesulfovibrionales bacterium]